MSDAENPAESMSTEAEIILATRIRDALREAVASGMSVGDAISTVIEISGQIAHANGGEDMVHQVAAQFMESQWREPTALN
jgi:3-deoxy-D-manno-octulosonate 8-phosphate phosphatase KdsC-like HAD superfamily phosphatase